MAEREKDQRLQELWDRGVKTYSFSKLNSLEQCPYGAYLNYIEKFRRRINQSIAVSVEKSMMLLRAAFWGQEMSLK